jgi:phosphoribosylamine--glycine ligase
MGSYSCADFSLPFLQPEDVAVAQAINEQVIAALHREVGPYRGVLYGGLIAVADGVRLIEYNARFGDPEALNVLPLLESDFCDLCMSVAEGRLGDASYRFRPQSTVCKYIVPETYPAATTSGGTLAVPAEFASREDLRWYWAACDDREGTAALTGSRAGAIVGIHPLLEEAERIAEDATGSINGPVRHRSDIGRSDVVERRVEHMRQLRNLPSDESDPASSPAHFSSALPG